MSTYEEHLTMSDETPQSGRKLEVASRISEVEVAIGARIRALRVAAGVNQSALGEALGVSSRQIQKYEKGKDRVAASSLQIFAAALGVHPGVFFDSEMPLTHGDALSVRTALEGAAGLQRISNTKLRKQLSSIITMLADEAKL